MASNDPLSMLLGKKKEEEKVKKTSPPAEVGGLMDDPFELLGSRSSPAPHSSGSARPATRGQVDSSGFPTLGAPRPQATVPDDDPFTLHLETRTAPGVGSGSTARDAFGAAAGAANMAFSAFSGAASGLMRAAAELDAPGQRPGVQAQRAQATHTAPPAQRAGGGGGGAGAVVRPPVPSTAAANTTFEDMLPGEKVHVNCNCFLSVANPLCELSGRLLVTNHRLKFQTPKGKLREELLWMRGVNYFDVNLGAVKEITHTSATTAAGVPEYKLQVKVKDHRVLFFLMTSPDDVMIVKSAFASLGTPGNPTLLFAFKHAEEVWALKSNMEDKDGWNLLDPVHEFALMGVETELLPNPASPWVVTPINNAYGLCSTYPAVLCLPRRMNDAELRGVAGFRKRGRLPAMSWCGGQAFNYASLWRCSQTTEGIMGIMGQKSPEDEKMVECIRRGGKKDWHRDLLVIDLRPWKSAWANKANGGGFEAYPRCRLVFGGIDNIHAVRKAWDEMGAAVAAVSEGEVGTWFKDVADSGWYDYIGAIISSTVKVVKEITEHRGNVMVHCSDGWDRTAQVTSLSMLCLDGRWRTQEGFLRLVQKEWCSFGHRFRTRLAVGEKVEDEYSPVFVQWLECVYQLVSQFPTAFEFNRSILLRLMSEVFSNRYGTFLCDNERERQEKVMPFALSLWSVLLRPDEIVTWRNPSYVEATTPIVPSVSQANYNIWEDFWWRFHPRGQRLQADQPPKTQPTGKQSPATTSRQASPEAPAAARPEPAGDAGGAASRPAAAAAAAPDAVSQRGPAGGASPPAAAAPAAGTAQASVSNADKDDLLTLSAPEGSGAAAAAFDPKPRQETAATQPEPVQQVFVEEDDAEDVFANPARRLQAPKPSDPLL